MGHRAQTLGAGHAQSRKIGGENETIHHDGVNGQEKLSRRIWTRRGDAVPERRRFNDRPDRRRARR